MALRGGYGLFYNNVADGSWSFPARANPPNWANPSSAYRVRIIRSAMVWETRLAQSGPYHRE